MNKWTQEVPGEPGWYLWRTSSPGDVSVVEPFLVYEMPGGVLHAQEYSVTREGAGLGAWLLSEWAYRSGTASAFMAYPLEYLRLGPQETNIALVRAFRELYHAAAQALNALLYPATGTVNDMVRHDLLDALNEIHKEE